MANIERLKVVHFTTDRVPNPFPGGDLPWQVYQGIRNAIVRSCRNHGPTGPMGEVKIRRLVKDPYMQIIKDRQFWQSGDKDPSYYVIPDQYNHERYLYAELYGDDPFNPSWLADVAETLRQFSGWGLGINNVPDSYVLIFGDKLMVNGQRLSRCSSAAEVVEVVRRLLRGADPA